jgi:coenzyme PQQ biosynthesis protein PqqD
MIGLNAVLRRAPDVRFRTVGDETVVIRQVEAEALVLNDVAGRILELVDGHTTVSSIVAQLEAEYEVDPGELEPDVLEYLTELAEGGLVEPVSRSSRG